MAMNLRRKHSLKKILYYYYYYLCLLGLACFCNGKKNNNNNIKRSGFKGMFIFGSSVVDNGNNNKIIGSSAKANYLPYGIDFGNNNNNNPTGRFSNGKNLADSIGDYLNLPLIPAFADPQTHGISILHGVNFASGGSGILDETGLIAGGVISLNEQIRNFEGTTLPELESQLRSEGRKILGDYLFLFAAGNNDYLLNYFLLPQPAESPQSFAAKLVSSYSDQLKRLYNLGARNFLLVSVYPLGCSPVISRGEGCLPVPNGVITIFYEHLISMVNHIKLHMPGSQIIVLNSVKVITDILYNANSTGLFNNVSGPCCEVSIIGLSCKANGRVRDNRNTYAYFDGQHNTESLSTIIATKAYTSCDPSEVYPFNLHKLARAHF